MLKVNGKEVVFFVNFLGWKGDEATFHMPRLNVPGRFRVTQAEGDFQDSEQIIKVGLVNNELVFEATWLEVRPSWSTEIIPFGSIAGTKYSCQVSRIMTQGAMNVQLYIFDEGPLEPQA